MALRFCAITITYYLSKYFIKSLNTVFFTCTCICLLKASTCGGTFHTQYVQCLYNFFIYLDQATERVDIQSNRFLSILSLANSVGEYEKVLQGKCMNYIHSVT